MQVSRDSATSTDSPGLSQDGSLLTACLNKELSSAVDYVNVFQERINRTGIQNNHPTSLRKVDTGFRELRAETLIYISLLWILVIFES